MVTHQVQIYHFRVGYGIVVNNVTTSYFDIMQP